MKNYCLIMLLWCSFLGYAQNSEWIRLNRNPYSNQFHGMVMVRENPKEKEFEFPILQEPRNTLDVYGQPLLTQYYFESVRIEKRDKKYDLHIKMNPKGRVLLDVNTSDANGSTLAFVFNDTIFGTEKIKEPNLTGIFTLKGLTQQQKDRVVEYYSTLPPTKVQLDFFKAVKEKQFKKADSLIKVGALVVGGHISKYMKERSQFESAFTKNDTTTITYLKKNNFSVAATSLNEAMIFSDVDFIKKYFNAKKGSDAYQKSLNQTLFNTAKTINLKIAKALVDLGANVDYTPKNRPGVLQYVAAYNTCGVLDYLVSKSTSKSMFKIFEEACYHRPIEDIDCILGIEKMDVNLTSCCSGGMMHGIINRDVTADFSSYKKGVAKMSYLLDKGANPLLTDDKGNTALHKLAVNVYNYVDRKHNYSSFDIQEAHKAIAALAKKMVEKGADPKTKNKDGLTPLAFAKANIEVSQRKNKQYKAEEDLLIQYLESLQ